MVSSFLCKYFPANGSLTGVYRNGHAREGAGAKYRKQQELLEDGGVARRVGSGAQVSSTG